jgi:membrane-associated phospholipid phosphatase
MAAWDGIPEPAGYGAQLVSSVGWSLTRLVRPPQQAPDPAAARWLWRRIAVLGAGGIVAIVLLMVAFDAIEIGLMPPRGAPGLEPVRILTDFGKDAYVLSLLAAVLIVIFVVTPLQPLAARGRLLRFATQVQYLFLAILVPVLCTDVLKWAIGRGRPFVGGTADPFNFAPFNGTAAYSSLPSAHAVTAFALAFAVAALWPRLRLAMYLYAIAIGLSRLVLLAHHPSDVVAGAVVGSIGAMAVSYWFAARRLGFAIRAGGRIVPR